MQFDLIGTVEFADTTSDVSKTNNEGRTMIRIGLHLTFCLVFTFQASLSFAQQRTGSQAQRLPTRPIQPPTANGHYPPMVNPDQFGRQHPVDGSRPKQIAPHEVDRFQAGSIGYSNTITISDQGVQSGQVRQVAYTQDSVPVPSILSGEASPNPSDPTSQDGAREPMPQFPLATPEPMNNPYSDQPMQRLRETNDGRTVKDSATFEATRTGATQDGPDFPSQSTSRFSATRLPFAHDHTENPIRNSDPTQGTSEAVYEPMIQESTLERQASHQEVTDEGVPTSLPNTTELQTDDRIASSFRTVEVSPDSASQIRTEGPKLRVHATGPSSVGIGKPARYEILVHNDDRTTANDVIVGVDIPGWIDVKYMNTTLGTRELTDGSQQNRLIWTVPQIASGTSEKLTIDVVPREAKMFDLNIEWTVMPIKGSASVQVTEPRLDVEISGPNEVQFGDKALYSVTVSNPGTGTAENVSVILPEALGGERAALGDIQPGRKKQIQVELFARQSGSIELTTLASADGDLRQTDSRKVIVRRGELDVKFGGPQMKYAGSVGTYEVVVANIGDAVAQDVIAAVALPAGVEYLSGVDAVEQVQGGIRWKVGVLAPNTERKFLINCQLSRAGEMNFEVAGRAKGDLAMTAQLKTLVEAVADLKLSIDDPPGPLPTGQEVVYQIKVRNRGSKIARQVEVVMQFSDGIEPTSAVGHANEVITGQVIFSPIDRIEPGQEITLKVMASASQPGKHVHRAQLICEEDGAREVVEGTTQFYAGNGESSSQLRTGNPSSLPGSNSIR